MSGSMAESCRVWFRCRQPRAWPRLRLVCFPHAGGAASFFRTWSARLPANIELLVTQYPGREDRLHEPCIDDMDVLAGSVADALRPALDRPVALFGHSMGAAVAYEVARRLEARRAPLVRLIVSGREGPHHQRPGSVHLRDDNGLVEELRRLGGTNQDVYDQPEWRALFLPPLRSDYRLIERYEPRRGPRLQCPVLACLGNSDPEVTSTEALGWGEVTRGAFDLRAFEGDHFYLVPQQARLIEELLRFLDADVPAESREAWPSTP